MKQFLLTHLPHIAFFVCVWVFVLSAPVTRCVLPSSFGFDAQNILAWKYAATTSVFPVRDVFYPYGAVLFYKDTNIFINIFASLFIPAYILLVAVFFGKRMHSMAKGFAIGVLFLVFVVIFSDLDSFLRYGASFAFVLYFLVLNKVERSKSFTIGVINGLVFSAFTDQGLLALTTMGIGNLLICILEKDFPVKKMLSSTARYLGGFFVGFVPLALHLLFTGGLLPYLESLLEISSIAAYAESPFLPFAFHPENLLVFLPLFSSILLLTFTQLFHREKPFSRLEKSMIFIVILTVLLEQRSLVRSISNSIVFLGPVLWTMFVIRFLRQEKRTEMKIFTIATSVLMLSLFGVTLPKISTRLSQLSAQIEYPQQRICSPDEVAQRALEHPAVESLRPYITEYFPLYVYPSDPALYAAFSAPLPPYFNSYNTAPIYAQQATIAWFKTQQTGKVVINTAELQMEGIPHHIRTPKLLAYIFSTYCTEALVSNYLILSDCNRTLPSLAGIELVSSEYANSLRQVDLGEIPRKEWQQKRSLFSNTEETLPLNRKELYILVTDSQPHTTVTLASPNETTTVTMNHCEQGCVINLSNLPIFFFEHTVSGVNAPETAKVEILRSSSPLPW